MDCLRYADHGLTMSSEAVREHPDQQQSGASPNGLAQLGITLTKSLDEVQAGLNRAIQKGKPGDVAEARLLKSQLIEAISNIKHRVDAQVGGWRPHCNSCAC